jgi:AcrR family transcriptional regulator
MNHGAQRPYRMTARAEQAAATGERIVAAAIALLWERASTEIPLDLVAERAGVSVQTVLRRFGSKDGLLAAAADRQRRDIQNQRDGAPVGDVRGAVAVLFDHYEEVGVKVLTLLSEERRVPELARIADEGRAYHRAWCARVFAPALAGLGAEDHDRRLAQLVAVCDVSMWKLLRIDARLPRPEGERALVELLEPLTTTDRSEAR